MEMTNRLHTPRTSIRSFSPTSYHSWTSEQPPHSSNLRDLTPPRTRVCGAVQAGKGDDSEVCLGAWPTCSLSVQLQGPSPGETWDQKETFLTYASEARELGQDNLEGCPSGSSHFLNLPILPLPEGGKASWKHPLWPKVLTLLPKRQNESVYIHFNSCES